jgi:C1A family cysteine protease
VLGEYQGFWGGRPMTDEIHNILVFNQTPDAFLTWSNEQKLAYYERTVKWHEYISDLMKTGEVSKAWGTMKLPGRVRPIATRSVLVAIYTTTLERFSQLITQDPLWDLAWYEAPILKSIEGDYEDDVERHKRVRARIGKKLGKKLPDPVINYEGEIPDVEPGEIEALVHMRNEPDFGLLSDENRLAQDERVLQMHHFHQQLRNKGIIANEWGTYQNCGFGVWAGGSRAGGVMHYKVKSYTDYDNLFQSDPVRGDSRVRTLVLLPFQTSWEREKQQLEHARRRLQPSLSARPHAGKLHGMGWRRDLPDHRDFLYSPAAGLLQALPPAVDMRTQFPPVYEQGPIESCTANVIAAAIQFDRIKTRQVPDFIPSRLFLYYNQRVLYRAVPYDTGGELRDVIKTISSIGVCPESNWPYKPIPPDPNTRLFPPNSAPATRPSEECYQMAAELKAISYFRIQQTLSQLKTCLAEGYPFGFGFYTYSSMYEGDDKPVTVIPLPRASDKQIGGHAVLAVGYRDSSQQFILRNSWGSKVQDAGYFYMPYAYVLDPNLAGDFWTIRRMSSFK